MSTTPELTEAVFLLEPHTLLLDVAGPAEALRLANQALQRQGRPPAFRLRYVAAQPDVLSSVGLSLGPLEPLPQALQAQSWLFLLGCRHAQPGEPAPGSAQRADALRTQRWLHGVGQQLLQQKQGRLVGICSGTLLAAQAGLLSGRRCTTHHELLDALRRHAPQAEVVDNRVFVLDGALASSAGVTAGIDLTLHLIQLRCGDAIAASVAQTMVVYLRRSPQDPQLSPLLAHRHHLHPAVHRVQDALCAQPGKPWSLQSMAEVAHVTPRHLGRLFGEHADTTPLRYLQAIRLELARRARQQGQSLADAAALAGFSSEQQWRRTQRAHAALGVNTAPRKP
ncbi:GlxA family transcriptional regulator [Roseateles sp. BYS180W]|uniref:GlxA family transcriptional regulator n=1 Tax=Roseateles rivi TaxID=3299028 RepID=A0ABW7FR78_9BURK